MKFKKAVSIDIGKLAFLSLKQYEIQSTQKADSAKSCRTTNEGLQDSMEERGQQIIGMVFSKNDLHVQKT